ncbi:MAG: two-component system, cell cycle response regulator DivK [Myxococcales bacterium]|nr:two-component system, cell cycle response regulator DivK [Myxococcales bacterium]
MMTLPARLAGMNGGNRRRLSPLPAPGDGTAPSVGDRLVLLVDDYEDTRLLYVEHLQDAGFRVIEATDGEEATRLALTLRPDAIIMDLSMPKLDGWDATRRIRADEAMKSTYIIALSAMDGEISREMAFDAGCNDFIAKPFLADALVQVLTVHFRGEPPSGTSA